jgi:hypothetical protein
METLVGLLTRGENDTNVKASIRLSFGGLVLDRWCKRQGVQLCKTWNVENS